MINDTTIEILKISFKYPGLTTDEIIEKYFEIKDKLNNKWLPQFRKPSFNDIPPEKIVPFELYEEKNT